MENGYILSNYKKVLHGGELGKLVELKDISDPQVTLGLIDIELALFAGNRPALLTRDAVEYQLKRESQDRQERDRGFFRYVVPRNQQEVCKTMVERFLVYKP